MNTSLIKLLKWFTTINLEELESSASFMTRIDTKYLIHSKDINQLLEQFKPKYFILSIHGHYIFHYDNVYMDTKDYDLYYNHEKGMSKRIKVRTRYYKDSDLAFFEFKQKEWDVTRKFRYKIDPSTRDQMTDNDQRFYASIYQSIDSKAPKHILYPSLGISFHRVTIVSKKSDERLTVDFDLTFTDLRNPKKQPIKVENAVIIESKSASTRTYSHQLMRKYWIRPAKWCSKYGFGLIKCKRVTSRNHFEDSIKTLKIIAQDHTRQWLRSPSLAIKPRYKKKAIKAHTKTVAQTNKRLQSIQKEIVQAKKPKYKQSSNSKSWIDIKTKAPVSWSRQTTHSNLLPKSKKSVLSHLSQKSDSNKKIKNKIKSTNKKQKNDT